LRGKEKFSISVDEMRYDPNNRDTYEFARSLSSRRGGPRHRVTMHAHAGDVLRMPWLNAAGEKVLLDG
jgi:hypothetical protein